MSLTNIKSYRTGLRCLGRVHDDRDTIQASPLRPLIARRTVLEVALTGLFFILQYRTLVWEDLILESTAVVRRGSGGQRGR